MNSLEQLKKLTIIVADTGNIDLIKEHKPQDATTNPSLLLQAAKLPEYKHLLVKSIDEAKESGIYGANDIKLTLEILTANFATEILKIIPGRVSIEVDASLSYDTSKTIEAAKRLIGYMKERGVGKERILIKISSTWEGIKAAEVLEKDGIHCNLTLLFSFAQAVACAEAGVTLISPFVGRIFDWYKIKRGVETIPPSEDPGVLSVTRIYTYYKTHGYKTQVMGASFRNIGEIKELAGCDLLTISPKLLEELISSDLTVDEKLSSKLIDPDLEKISLDEPNFRWLHNEDEMATVKLSEGIRNFNKDWVTLSNYILETNF